MARHTTEVFDSQTMLAETGLDSDELGDRLNLAGALGILYLPLDVILSFATPSTFHGVAKHAIFAGVQRQRRSAPAEQGAQHL